MESEYAAVIKAKECSMCGAMNHVGYRFNELIVDGACGFCGSMLRWKRDGAENDTLELVRIDEEEAYFRKRLVSEVSRSQ